MTPAVARSAARTNFEVVVLPQPDSPTRPSVSALLTVKLMPSTALTEPALPNRPAPFTGKCFFRPRTSSSGSAINGLGHQFRCCHQPAACRAAVNALLGRLPDAATIHRMAAARVEAAPGRQGREVGRLTRYGVERLLGAKFGDRVEQRLGVGVPRGVEQT